MKKQDFLNSKLFRFMLPIIIVGSIISIFRAGYETGQWLYVIFR